MKFYIPLFLFMSTILYTQTNSDEVHKSWKQKQELEKTSWFKSLILKNIGPTIMSGRVVDLAVNPQNPTEFYVAYASGGLWYTNNNGNSFEPILDTAPTQNCGAVSVDWRSGTIWLGTGEANSSRSSYAGIGLLRSKDKGKTWENVGLKESHHISKILINPDNSDEIIVGVIGHLYTKNNERGVFKTLDGGKTWKQTLFVNDESGVIDVTYAPNDFSIQYASVWQRDRKAWHFSGSGISSGIYKSTDGGTTWYCVTNGDNGFPHNEGIGRIGLASYNENVIYAILDNQNKRPSLQNINPKDLNKTLLETEIIGAEVYKTEDGGKTWKKTNEKYIDDLFYTYGYYFANIAVDKKNPNHIFTGGVSIILSEDGGKTFRSIQGDNVHADHHVIWINPNNSNHIINGNDGGVNISYDAGKNWLKCNNQAVGQFYTVNVDEQEPYNVYGGLQDNGVWVGPNDYKHSLDWQQEGIYPYQFLSGGDGMQVQIDNRNPNIIITGSQFGYYQRMDRAKNKSVSITPKPNKEEKPYRFNWQTPILLSSHNQDILYMGSNFLHRSMNQGDTWEIISPDLTKGAKEGNITFGTITTISESKLQFGLLYTGSDDGLIHISKDGGASWRKISDSLPQNFWVSRIVASIHTKERVYATLNGYRNDVFTTMIYISDDYGQTWKAIASNMPNSPVNVIIEDHKNENILYVGTDNGLYITLDRGLVWQDFTSGMPKVAIHDLVLQKKSNDLVIGTHGRSLYKVNVEKVQQIKDQIHAKDIILCPIKPIFKSEHWGSAWSNWEKISEPKTEFWFYSNKIRKVELKLKNNVNQIVFSQEIEAMPGLNKIDYNFQLPESIVEKWKKKDPNIKIPKAKNNQFYLPISKCQLILESEGIKEETIVEIIASE
ncbi:VPS10 domain-containing protein [Flavobacterium columnare]|uniref:VPS10 domain-containing protein n=1 Tax=Flavobacterium columnare TaxID=996 RepID=UPI0013D39E88|nr:glycosyl hydrolase [Flavobacterium columnare]